MACLGRRRWEGCRPPNARTPVLSYYPIPSSPIPLHPVPSHLIPPHPTSQPFAKTATKQPKRACLYINVFLFLPPSVPSPLLWCHTDGMYNLPTPREQWTKIARVMEGGGLTVTSPRLLSPTKTCSKPELSSTPCPLLYMANQVWWSRFWWT